MKTTMYFKKMGGIAMLILGMGFFSHEVIAQAWPNKPIKLVVPFGPGGANDLVARAVAEGLTRELGQSVVVENKPGAGSVLGADFVAKSAPDGYTFLAPAAGIVTNSLIKSKMPYKESDLVPIAMIAVSPSIIVVASDSPYKDIKSLIEASKKGQGFHFSTAGTGSTPHIVAEMIKIETGAQFDIIPYKSGSEGMVAVVGHQTDLTSEASVVTIPQIKGGKLRPLASTWSSRISVLADVPTMKELGYSQVLIGHWTGMFAPTGTAPEILEKMNTAIDRALKQPEIRNRLIAQGIEPIGGSRETFQKYLKDERERLAKVVKISHMIED
jgi:tripartite-type tricarboxylate transporter receptor subunit TctC